MMITKFKLITAGVMVAFVSGCATTNTSGSAEVGDVSDSSGQQCVAVALAASAGCLLYSIGNKKDLGNTALRSAACYGVAYLGCQFVSNYVSRQEKDGEELRKTNKPTNEPKLVNYSTTLSPQRAAPTDSVVLESTVGVVAPANQPVSIQERLVMVDQNGIEWINKTKDIAVSDGGVYQNTFKFQPEQARLAAGTYDVKRQVIVQNKPLGNEKSDKLEVKSDGARLSMSLTSNN